MDIDLKNIPEQITKGDTVNFKLNTSLNETSEIELTIKNELSQIKQKYPVASGSVIIEIPSETTQNLASGDSILTLRCIDGEKVRTLYCAPIYIFEIGSNDAIEELITWKKNLAAIDAVLGKNAGSEFSFYMIAGRQVNKMAPTELIRLREYFIRQIRNSEAEFKKAKGLRRTNVIVTRFGRQY